MMMRMLEAGGLPVLSDGMRAADEDNPKGYYELEKVKSLKLDASWLGEVEGKALKVVSLQLEALPAGYDYRVLFMRRRLQEVLDSQRRIMRRRGVPPYPASDERMLAYYERHLARKDEWLKRQPHVELLYVDYNDVLERPAEWAERVNAFLGGFLDATRMVAVVDAELYRHRS